MTIPTASVVAGSATQPPSLPATRCPKCGSDVFTRDIDNDLTCAMCGRTEYRDIDVALSLRREPSMPGALQARTITNARKLLALPYCTRANCENRATSKAHPGLCAHHAKNAQRNVREQTKRREPRIGRGSVSANSRVMAGRKLGTR